MKRVFGTVEAAFEMVYLREMVLYIKLNQGAEIGFAGWRVKQDNLKHKY